MTHLKHSGVEDFNGVWVVRVERLADETDHLAAADGAGVVLNADDVGDDEAEQVGLRGGREGLREGVLLREKGIWVLPFVGEIVAGDFHG